MLMFSQKLFPAPRMSIFRIHMLCYWYMHSVIVNTCERGQYKKSLSPQQNVSVQRVTTEAGFMNVQFH
jgi:hypothetical protein